MGRIGSDKKGFTLVELVVVMTILAILAAVIVPSVTGYVQKAQKSTQLTNAQMVYNAAQLYLIDQDAGGSISDSTFSGADLVDAGYISPLPKGDTATLTVTINDQGKAVVSCSYLPKDAENPILWPDAAAEDD